MKAVRFSEYGGPEVLRVVEVEPPHAGPGEVRIAVRAAGVNPPDWKIRAGLRQQAFPRTLPTGVGFEASGVVDEVGEGVVGVEIGDAVFGKGSDTFAEYAVLTAWARKPQAMTFEEAAAISSSGETALRILDLVGAKAGQTALVSGAAGGSGSAVVQLARRRGLTVIGTASEAKHEYLRSLGALPTTYEAGLVERVRALAPQGIDVAFDIVGSGVIAELVALTGDPSRVVTIVFAEADKGVLSSFTVQDHPEKALAELARAYEEGAFRMRVDKTFALEDTGQAQVLSEAGRTTGKLVVVTS